jgi:hypothetical protein
MTASRFTTAPEEAASQQLMKRLAHFPVATNCSPQSTKYHLALCNTPATFSSVQMIFAYLFVCQYHPVNSRKNNVPLGSLTLDGSKEQRSQKDLGSVQKPSDIATGIGDRSTCWTF